MALRVKIEDEHGDVLDIRIQEYGNAFEYQINTPTERDVRSGTIYNHDAEDILGLISKIATINGKI